MDTRELTSSLSGRLGDFTVFLGVFSSDKLPSINFNPKPVIFIANTLHSNTSVTTVGHWVCFYLEFQPVGNMIFFDSFGFPPGFYNSDFLTFINEKYPKFNVFDFGVQMQPNESQKCGLYVLNFVHYVSHYGIEKFKCFFKNRFNSKNLRQNDAIVTRYYFKHLSKHKTCTYWKKGRKRAITYAECKKIER